MNGTKGRLAELNRIEKETDGLYHGAARAMGLSDCASWILYSLREPEETTQSGLCASLYETKQTVNSAIKKLEREGYVELCLSRDRRSKVLRLTERGAALAEGTVDRLRTAELAALGGMGKAEQETLLALLQRYSALLKEELQKNGLAPGE